MNVIILVSLISTYIVETTCWFNPISYLACSFRECCNNNNKYNSPQTLAELDIALNQNLFGQHVAHSVIISALEGHIYSTNPSKSLTLSFHGQGGIGKTYVAKMIMSHFYESGAASKYCHYFNGRSDFPVANNHTLIEEYKDKLRTTIIASLLECPLSMFVIDDVHMMASSVLDVLVPFLDSGSTTVEYQDSRIHLLTNRAIFIFVANTFSSTIMTTLSDLLKSGKTRHQIKSIDFENKVKEHAFIDLGGFQHSEIIVSELIDHYIVFLPLQYDHVVQCIQKYFYQIDNRYPSEEEIKQVLSSVTFHPEPDDMFAKSGCRRIEVKVKAMVFKRRQSTHNDDL